ncbi:MAG: tetratricopeptide repeat protein [Pseudomonadales bacterium]
MTRNCLTRHTVATVLAAALALVLGACSTAPPVQRPAPTDGLPFPPAPAAQTEGVTPADAPVAPSPPADAKPRSPTSDATDVLLVASENAAQSGDTRSAISYLERAIRLDGRNAALWARLSGAYLRDGRPALARQYANRSLAMAGSRLDWKRAAMLAIADIEEREGNFGEALRIRALYASERG